MRHIQFSKIKPSPWKNGLGITYQLDIFPEMSDFFAGGYDFRISMAKVSFDSEFSIFENKKRYLKILEGEGIFLNQKELNKGESCFFKGDEKIHARLKKANDAVLDLGIIFNEKKINVVEIKNKNEFELEFTFIYLINLKPNFKLQNIEMNYLDCLVFDKNDSFNFSSLDNLNDCVLIGIDIIG